MLVLFILVLLSLENTILDCDIVVYSSSSSSSSIRSSSGSSSSSSSSFVEIVHHILQWGTANKNRQIQSEMSLIVAINS